MKDLSYVVQRYDGACLDTTNPDTWTNDPRTALASSDKAWIERHAARRSGCSAVERQAAIATAKHKGLV